MEAVYEKTLQWFTDQKVTPSDLSSSQWPDWCLTQEEKKSFLVMLVTRQLGHQSYDSWSPPSEVQIRAALEQHSWNQFEATMSFF